MITTDNSPWSDIKKPLTGYNIIRVDPTHPHNFFWGKDVDESYLLLFEISKELAEAFENKVVDLKGVKTDITYHAAISEYFFILCLQNKKDADIFYRLCLDLVDRTREVLVKNVALEVINTRLKRWKSFLSGKKKYLLSDREVRGLFAELEFIHECIGRSVDHLTILEGWQGPLDGPHDFVLGDFAVEVKSVTGSQKGQVRISSENQLITHLHKLFLHVTFLAEFHDCVKGISLNKQVEIVRDAIKEPEHREVFDSRLCETGYLELKDYDTPCYCITKHESFLVREGFPRIIPENLTDGIANVTYDLDLKSLDEYVCEFPLDEEIL